MDSGDTWRLGHRPALDGLRGVAILLVLVCHTVERQWPNALGSAGVTVFFTLSGFLITALLLEGTATGRFTWRRFYSRRARRLLPALALMLAVVGSLLVAAGLVPGRALVWVVLYVANWAGSAGIDMSALSHMWSLAIEEQFYLVWPVVLVLTRRWRHGPLVAASVGIVVAIVLRFALWGNGWQEYVRVSRGSDTRMDALLVGCALAILLTAGVRIRIPATLTAGAAVLTLAALVAAPERWGSAILAPTVVPWVTALGLLYALSSPAWLASAWMRWFGKRSYGIYLWHYPLIFLTANATGDNQPAIVVALVASIGVAALSWRYVEQPFMRAGHETRKKSKDDSVSEDPFSATISPICVGVNPGL